MVSRVAQDPRALFVSKRLQLRTRHAGRMANSASFSTKLWNMFGTCNTRIRIDFGLCSWERARQLPLALSAVVHLAQCFKLLGHGRERTRQPDVADWKPGFRGRSDLPRLSDLASNVVRTCSKTSSYKLSTSWLVNSIPMAPVPLWESA